MSINLPPGVSLHPNSSTRNRVQPTGDYPCVALRPFSDTQISPVMTLTNAAGTQTWLSIDPKGNLLCANGGLNITFVAPTGTVDFDSGAARTQINAANLILTLGTNGSGSLFPFGSLLDFESNGVLGPTVGSPYSDPNFYITGRNAAASTIFQGATSQSAPLLRLQGITSTSAARDQVDVTTTWATSTDAARKARAVFNVYDTAAREALRLEASGSAAMIGFLGASAVVQQSSTADLKDAWCGFGFQVNGGATPMNLDGGSMTAANYATAIATKIADYTLTATDGTILADATTGGFSVTLPTAVGITGRVYVVKKIDTGSNLVTVVPNGAETIDGSASAPIGIPETALALQSDGAVWRII